MAELYSFCLQTANESAAVVLPVKWGVGRGKIHSKSKQCFFTNLCLVGSGEREKYGIPNNCPFSSSFVSELQCTVLHKSV